jgi:hypothetical protein
MESAPIIAIAQRAKSKRRYCFSRRLSDKDLFDRRSGVPALNRLGGASRGEWFQVLAAAVRWLWSFKRLWVAAASGPSRNV